LRYCCINSIYMYVVCMVYLLFHEEVDKYEFLIPECS
jgi:hypothetical protein